MNQSNLLHSIAPFSSLFTALLLLNKAPNTPFYSDGSGIYYPVAFISFSIILIGVALMLALNVRETLQNFLIFLPVYPVWFFAAIAPLLATTAYAGAWTSLVIYFLAMFFQICLYISREGD